MATICPVCRSADTVPLVDNQQCHHCGALFDFQGNRIESDRGTVVGGNYADLQRAGADAATGKGKGALGDAVVVPPTTDNPITPAEHEASRGEITTETVRTGLADDLIAAQEKAREPADEVGGRSYDPTSTSPQPAEATSKRSSKAKSADKE